MSVKNKTHVRMHTGNQCSETLSGPEIYESYKPLCGCNAHEPNYISWDDECYHPEHATCIKCKTLIDIP